MKKRDAQNLTDKVLELLKKEQQKRGVSNYYISKDTGLSHSTLHNIEKGQQSPTLTTLFLIAKSLEIRLSDIIKDIEDNS